MFSISVVCYSSGVVCQVHVIVDCVNMHIARQLAVNPAIGRRDWWCVRIACRVSSRCVIGRLRFMSRSLGIRQLRRADPCLDPGLVVVTRASVVRWVINSEKNTPCCIARPLPRTYNGVTFSSATRVSCPRIDHAHRPTLQPITRVTCADRFTRQISWWDINIHEVTVTCCNGCVIEHRLIRNLTYLILLYNSHFRQVIFTLSALAQTPCFLKVKLQVQFHVQFLFLRLFSTHAAVSRCTAS